MNTEERLNKIKHVAEEANEEEFKETEEEIIEAVEQENIEVEEENVPTIIIVEADHNLSKRQIMQAKLSKTTIIKEFKHSGVNQPIRQILAAQDENINVEETVIKEEIIELNKKYNQLLLDLDQTSQDCNKLFHKVIDRLETLQ